MKGRITGNCKRLIFSLLTIMNFCGSAFSFQTNVHAVINKYARVNGIGPYPTTGYVYVNDAVQLSQFAAGDTVLLIQMKGAQATVLENSSFGALQNYVGSPGKYEFIIIQSVDGGLKKIVFRNNIINSYDVNGDVQIIKTPSYNSVLVDTDLTCATWDSVNKIGGVLTMIVGKTIRLNANIDVTGKGFLGGGLVTGQGICANTDQSLFFKYSYNLTSDSSGLKGESPVSMGWISFITQLPIFPSFSRGKGANFTGGGGGDGNSSGGGGGANYGAGGKGGRENNACIPNLDGGLGGRAIHNTVLDSCIFLGAGGGSSTYYSGSTPSPGGNGGGIIIILCDTIIGNGKIISADGATASKAIGNAGAGGGGGGGSVALYLGGFSTSNITISAKGGKGGDNTGSFGEGGGGGGGFIYSNNITISGNVTRNITGGAVGYRPGSITGSNGSSGGTLNHFVAVLNGFLFNSIRSSVTGDQVDSICSNMMPHKITGTKPVGGTLPYTYLWEKSYDQITWTTLAPDTDPDNYTPSVIETSTVYFRRTITDSSIPAALVDVSKPVKIIVQPFIKNNIIGTSDTICFAQNSPGFISKAVLQDGNGKYTFKWQVSLDNSLFNLPLNAYTAEAYTPPPALLATSWYRRTVISGRCIDSTAIVKITVLDTIKNNTILTTPAPICYGMIFPDLSATNSPALAGGDNIYKFKWENSTNGTAWTTASGTSNGINYNPDELSAYFPGSQYFRRIVYSGIHDVCINYSTPKLLTDWPIITNNSISANQTIGHDSIPATLTGTPPANGSGSYTYFWQYKTKTLSWTTAPGVNNLINYSPPALTDTTWYRRAVSSSACSDTSNIIIVNVHKTIITNNIAFVSGAVEDTICNGSTPAIFKGTLPAGGSNILGDYSFQWYYSLNNSAWNPVTTAGSTKDYQPGALSVTTWFRRNVSSPVTSPSSTSKSNSIKITVLPLIANKDIAADQIICKGNPVAAITGSSGSPAGGDNTYRYTWRQDSASTGWKNIPGYYKNSFASYSRSYINDPFRYKRYVYSGSDNCCADSSNIVSIGIYPLPTGAITTVTDTTVCSGLPVPVKIHLTGAPKWRLIYNENGVQATISKIQALDTTLLISRTPAGAFSSYLFKIDSLKDANKCVATPAAITGSRKINVYKVPKSVAGIALDSVCGPGYHLAATPSVGTGTWTKTVGLGTVTFLPDANDPNAIVKVDSTTSAWGLENAYKFSWKEDNWLCYDSSSVQILFYKRTSVAYAGKDKDTLYTFDKYYTLHVSKALVGTGIWSVIKGDGLGDAKIMNDSVAYDIAYAPDKNKFLWKITNGKCQSADTVTYTVFDIKIPQGFSPNNDGKNDEFVISGFDPDPLSTEITLRIINSAGTEVFFTANTDGNTWTNWNGQNKNGILPEGTYYYIFTIKSKRNNTVLPKSGFIILKRSKESNN